MEENKQHITGMLKIEYAKLLGIPASTLRNYMNKHFIAELAMLSYTKDQKYLTPRQIDFLNKKLVVTPD